MSERTTTMVSALVALAILGLGVTARPTGDPTSGRVEALESDLRFQIEMSWRHDGRTREAREEQLQATLAAWEASPQTGPDRQLLETWLRGAIVGTLPGESGEFPPTPAFSELVVDAKKPPAIVPGTDAKPPALPGAVEPPPASKPKADATASAAAPSLPRDVPLKPGQAYTPPKAKEFRITPRVPGSGQAATPPAAPINPAAPLQQAAAARPKRVVAAKPAEVPPPAPVRFEESTTASANAKQPPRVAEQAPAVVQNEFKELKEQKHEVPAVATLPPESKPAVANTADPEASQPIAQELRAAPVMVNLAELNAQIRGYHDGLDEIEATVVARDGKLTEGEVAQLVGQLEQLAVQHQFVRLYYDGLSKSERRFVAAPRSMEETIELVDGQRAALVAEDEDFLTALEGDVAKDELKQRLDAVAKEVGADKE